jgi:hypothetical protein
VSFSAGNSQPAEAPQPLGIPRHRASSNQQARPVPYIMGKQRIGVTFMSDKFNVTAFPRTGSSGKGQSSISGYDYFAAIACLICGGPIDAIYAVYLNGDLTWGANGPYAAPIATRGAAGTSTADFVPLNIPLNAAALLYWGTETQQLNGVLAQNTTLTLDDNTVDTSDTIAQIQHTAYRGYSYILLDQLYLGFNQTNFQNIEVVVGCYRKQPWMTFAVNVNGDANPIAVICDWLQNPRFGIGIPDSMLNIDELNAAGHQLATEKIGISPLIDQEQAIRDLILQACDYFGGYSCFGDDGLFTVRLQRKQDRDTLPVIDTTLMTSRPTFDPVDASETINELRLTFTNVYNDLTNDYRPYRNSANRLLNGGTKEPETWDATKWLTNPDLVERLVRARGQAKSVPQKTGKVSLRRVGTLYEDLEPGASFVFDYPSRDLGHAIFRVLKRSIQNPASPEFEIEFEQDFAYLFPLSGSGRALSDVAERAVIDIDVQAARGIRMIELPSGFCSDGKIAIAALIARPEEMAIGFDVYLERNYAGGASYALIESQRIFAQHGLLQGELRADGMMIERAGFLVQLDGPDTVLDEQTLWDGLSDGLLVFVGDEVLSVTGWELVGDGLYRLFVVRQQFATEREDHVAGDEAFIIKSSDLVALQHKHFQIANTATFKIVPRTATKSGDIADATAIDLLIAGKAFVLPKMENLRVNSDLRPTFAPGAGVAVSWTLTQGGFVIPGTKAVFDFLSLAGAELGQLKRTAADEAAALDHATLVAALGGIEQSFRLRARFETERPEGFLYSQPRDLVVTKTP